MTFDSPGQFQFKYERGNGGGCQLALAHQFVNWDRGRSEQPQDELEPGVLGYRPDGAAPWRHRKFGSRRRGSAVVGDFEPAQGTQLRDDVLGGFRQGRTVAQ